MNMENLIRQAQSGDDEAVDELIKKFFPLVSINARKFFIIGAEQEDLVQEGLIGLLKAIKFYRAEKSSFKTFASLCIKTQIFSAIKIANNQKNMALNEAILNGSDKKQEKINLELTFDKTNPENIFIDRETIREFKKFSKNNFSSLEREIFEYLIRGYSYKEIAQIL
ncbi:MAG: sigma-70 family RNA polymerase sigma factor, partial [Fusobacterium sp.]|nr:sigma-70 family RNA polymerase sigma factor [Fusobacterium sp.]